MNIKRCLAVCVLFWVSSAVLAIDLDRTDTGFVYPIGKRDFSSGKGWWLSKDPDYFYQKYHNGVDMLTKDSQGKDVSAPAYAIADGRIYFRHCDDASWGPGNCALFIEHKTFDGQIFTGVYGHLMKSSLPVDNDVYIGQSIGRTGTWSAGMHLHFGIFRGNTKPATISGVRGWGMMNVSQWTDPCEGNVQCTNGFIDPVKFIKTNYAYNPSTEHQTKCVGNICWAPSNMPCEQANEWYRLRNDPVVPYADVMSSSVCSSLNQQVQAIAQNPHHDEAVPEDKWWQSWWRYLRGILGEVVHASDIPEYGVIRTINVNNQYAVVAGNGMKASHGTGVGFVTQVTEAATPNLPDFIVTKAWLTTLRGTETYQYGLNESLNIKAQSKNIGAGLCGGDITGHFYLSKGYKEDVHSGDGAWRRVGSSTTHCSSLNPNNTHTETENMVISNWITVPGIYNIVYCIDHPLDDHNNGGDYPEEHESNNCSTEAVFEVLQAFESPGNFTPENSLNAQQKAALSAVITKYLLDNK